MTQSNAANTDTEAANGSQIITAAAGILTFTVVVGTFMYFGSETVIPYFAGGFVGLIAGVIAAIVASKRGYVGIARISLLACLIAGIAGGLILAGPLSLILVIVSLMIKKRDVNNQLSNT